GLAQALGGRVRVTGPRPDVEAVLAAADVACLPSRQEAFGNVVLEACAAGVPVVTTRRAGAAELLEGPLAALVVDDPEDLDALARALAHALGPAHDALAQAARARAEQFPGDKHLDGLEGLLAAVALGEGRAGGAGGGPGATPAGPGGGAGQAGGRNGQGVAPGPRTGGPGPPPATAAPVPGMTTAP